LNPIFLSRVTDGALRSEVCRTTVSKPLSYRKFIARTVRADASFLEQYSGIVAAGQVAPFRSEILIVLHSRPCNNNTEYPVPGLRQMNPFFVERW